jgi:outer membrane protein assembly factor BamB
MKSLLRIVGAVFLVSFLAGCSLFSTDEEVGPEPTPLVKFKAQADIERQWSASVGDGVGERYLKMTPAIDGKMIYAADAKGVVAAFDRMTGKRQWRVSLKESLSGGVGAGYGLVLVGTSSGHLLALNKADGSQAWRVAVSSEILSAPQTNASTVVVQTQDEKIFGFEHATGAQRWQYESSTPTLSLRGTSTPVLTTELAILGMGNGQVIALNADNGAVLWKQRATVAQGRSEFERMTDVDGDLLLAGNALYATSFQGFVVAFDVNTGRPIWRRELSSYQGPDEGLGNVYVSAADDELHAVTESDNELSWTQSALKYREITAPVTFANYVAVADGEGYLHVMSQRDGSFVARKKIDGDGVRSKLLAKGKVLYIYGNSGKLVAVTVQ